MNKIKYPEDYLNIEEFESSINYTVSETGFRAELIEKDYFCSLLLYYFYNNIKNKLIFKGGTCLNKVYMDFYRLSEDLDFTIPVELNISRSERSKSIKSFKIIYNEIEKNIDAFKIKENLKGYNDSRQYIGLIQYNSVITGQPGSIKVEVGLREPLLDKSFYKKAKTLLSEPYYGISFINDLKVVSLSLIEAMSEKVRAALTRKEIAIRDFYDIYYAINKGFLNIQDEKFIKLVKLKLDYTNDPIIDINDKIKSFLLKQLNSRLKPILRKKDYDEFNLDAAIKYILKIKKSL